jgi:hypothetical protein
MLFLIKRCRPSYHYGTLLWAIVQWYGIIFHRYQVTYHVRLKWKNAKTSSARATTWRGYIAIVDCKKFSELHKSGDKRHTNNFSLVGCWTHDDLLSRPLPQCQVLSSALPRPHRLQWLLGWHCNDLSVVTMMTLLRAECSPCASEYITHHHMEGRGMLCLNVVERINMALIHVEEKVCRELYRLMHARMPLINGCIELIWYVTKRL